MKVIGLLIVFCVAIWVFCDARARDKSILVALMWSFGTLVFLVVFLPLWLITRPKKNQQIMITAKSKHCTSCGESHEGTPSYCTNCGKALSD